MGEGPARGFDDAFGGVEEGAVKVEKDVSQGKPLGSASGMVSEGLLPGMLER